MYKVYLKARAKINLTLDVLGVRADGYHEVEMIMQTINLYDDITIKKIRKDKILINTNLKWLPRDERNLAYKTAQIMRERFHIEEGIFIDLQKKIPVSAGLAGGSTDAAAVLVGINKLFRLGQSKEELMKIGEIIGSDVPFCVKRGTAIAKGRGEKVVSLPAVPFFYLVIAKPGFSVSTGKVYGRYDSSKRKSHPDNNAMIEAIQNKDLIAISSNLCNALEDVTISQYPIIDEIKKYLIDNGAMNALMSGSGPSVYGIFRDRRSASEAVYKLKYNNIVRDAFAVSVFR